VIEVGGKSCGQTRSHDPGCSIRSGQYEVACQRRSPVDGCLNRPTRNILRTVCQPRRGPLLFVLASIESKREVSGDHVHEIFPTNQRA
jgi:hypothetical protein